MNDSRHVALVKRAISYGKIAQAQALADGATAPEAAAAYSEALEAHMPPPSTGWDRAVECGRWGCACTHTAPCDRGWVEMPPRVHHTHPYQRVAPCPVCRAEAAARYDAAVRSTSRSVTR